MKPETIKELLDQGTTSDQLVEILHQDKHIRETKEHLETQIQKEIERHRSTIQELNAAIHQNKLNCSHHETTYYPDPSGNNDSCYICTACGKEAKRDPKLKPPETKSGPTLPTGPIVYQTIKARSDQINNNYYCAKCQDKKRIQAENGDPIDCPQCYGTIFNPPRCGNCGNTKEPMSSLDKNKATQYICITPKCISHTTLK